MLSPFAVCSLTQHLLLCPKSIPIYYLVCYVYCPPFNLSAWILSMKLRQCNEKRAAKLQLFETFSDDGCVWNLDLLLPQGLDVMPNLRKSSSCKCMWSNTAGAINPFTHTSPVPRTRRISGLSSKPSKILSSEKTLKSSTWNRQGCWTKWHFHI